MLSPPTRAGNPPVGCEQHRAALPDQAEDAVPQEASGSWVHPRRGLILQPQRQPPVESCPTATIPPHCPTDQEDDGGAAEQGDGRGQLTLVAPTICACQAVCMWSQTQLGNAPLSHL